MNRNQEDFSFLNNTVIHKRNSQEELFLDDSLTIDDQQQHQQLDPAFRQKFSNTILPSKQKLTTMKVPHHSNQIYQSSSKNQQHAQGFQSNSSLYQRKLSNSIGFNSNSRAKQEHSHFVNENLGVHSEKKSLKRDSQLTNQDLQNDIKSQVHGPNMMHHRSFSQMMPSSTVSELIRQRLIPSQLDQINEDQFTQLEPTQHIQSEFQVQPNYQRSQNQIQQFVNNNLGQFNTNSNFNDTSIRNQFEPRLLNDQVLVDQSMIQHLQNPLSHDDEHQYNNEPQYSIIKNPGWKNLSKQKQKIQAKLQGQHSERSKKQGYFSPQIKQNQQPDSQIELFQVNNLEDQTQQISQNTLSQVNQFQHSDKKMSHSKQNFDPLISLRGAQDITQNQTFDNRKPFKQKIPSHQTLFTDKAHHFNKKLVYQNSSSYFSNSSGSNKIVSIKVVKPKEAYDESCVSSDNDTKSINFYNIFPKVDSALPQSRKSKIRERSDSEGNNSCYFSKDKGSRTSSRDSKSCFYGNEQVEELKHEINFPSQNQNQQKPVKLQGQSQDPHLHSSFQRRELDLINLKKQEKSSGPTTLLSTHNYASNPQQQTQQKKLIQDRERPFSQNSDFQILNKEYQILKAKVWKSFSDFDEVIVSFEKRNSGSSLSQQRDFI
eukprot:403358706